MTDTTEIGTPGASVSDQTEAFAERLFGSYIASMEVMSIQIGLDLGLYRVLDAAGWSTPAGLAEAAGIHERYAREWLEQQAVAGVLGVDDPSAAADRRRFRLPAAHRPVLLEEASTSYVAAGAVLPAVISAVMPRLREAYQTGGGVPYADYGRQTADAIRGLNAPAYLAELGSVWLPSIPAVDTSLRRPGSRVLDVGCGQGVTSVEIARAYPGAEVVGLDLDEASVAVAREATAAAGLADRVTFVAADAASQAGTEPFDLVTIFEALHDMGDPVGALRACRQVLAPEGRVLVADERVAEEFTVPGDDLERLNYGFSVLHCLPATMAESPVEANGTVLRPATVARWSREAGFTRLEQLPIESQFWRFYLMVP
jgi:2-polyprenyl-3-methyl-5-hydroxy-6-metoxy-1,4-benzoquinol methylase